MVRRSGWVALAVFAGLGLVATALSTAWSVGLAVRDDEIVTAIGALVFGLFGVAFWRWIALGAWLRAHPPLDPETGEPLRQPEDVGPWGVVGRVLLGLMVLAFVGIGLWSTTLDRQSTNQAEAVRDLAERRARRDGLTVADVATAKQARVVWSAGGTGRPDPYLTLLPVDGARVVSVSTSDDGAAILLEPDRSPPCVVLTVDRNDLVRSRLSQQCS